MGLRRACIACFALAALATTFSSARADFVLTDKLNANGVTIPTGNTGTGVYVMETKNTAFLPSNAPSVAGFTFDAQDGSGPLLTNNSSTDRQQGYAQSLAGNAENGYVGTVQGKSWGNAITVSFAPNTYLMNGPGADIYITAKNVVGGVVQSTSSQDKSFAIAFHVINQGSLNGWHLYNATALAPNALPSNFEPAEGAGNVLGAIDLSTLALATGVNNDVTGLPTMPTGTWIDKVTLVNNNAANANAWGFLGDTSEAPTQFVARRDFDNADGDNNAYTGVDYLTGRYGARYTNGQDGPQAWFLGLMNVETVPEANAFWLGSIVASVMGLVAWSRAAWRKAACRGSFKPSV